MDIYKLNEESAKEYLSSEGILDILEKRDNQEISPDFKDLARLYKLVIDRKPFSILEFGSGFSTIVMASALKKNVTA